MFTLLLAVWQQWGALQLVISYQILFRGFVSRHIKLITIRLRHLCVLMSVSSFWLCTSERNLCSAPAVFFLIAFLLICIAKQCCARSLAY